MIKAIETKYKGYRFRSRLEARWAVFFDAMGWQWEYEPEGFDLGNGVYYLPDFKVFGEDSNGDYNVFYFEVKPLDKALSSCEEDKIMKFAQACHNENLTRGYGDFVLLDGPPRETSFLSAGEYVRPMSPVCEPRYWAMDVIYRNGRPTFQIDCEYPGFSRDEMHSCSKETFISGDYIGARAIEKARSARFEHGECG